MRAQILTLLMASYETTGSVLAFAWHLLGTNPDAEQTLHAELAAVLGGREPTYEDVPQLRYTRAVMAEAMRLYPPGYMIARQALEQVALDGATLEPGDR